MKKLITVIIFILALSCYKKSGNSYNNPPPNNGNCGTFNGYKLYKDGQGCYYNGSNYSKVYVDSSSCNCP